MADKKISALTAATTPLAGTEVLPIVQSSTTKKVASDDLTVKNIRSNATTGILQVAGPAASQTRVMTVPDANFTAARTDAGQTFNGTQVMTSPRIVTSINDTNGNELVGITATASAVNELTVANAATGANPVISATGTDTDIGITLTPKGTGNAVLTSGNLVVANGNGIDFSATAHAAGMTSELLSDYEEGTWTPQITDATNNATMGANNSGTYTKIGRFVNCQMYVETTSLGSMSGPGSIYISGWPFSIAQSGGGFLTAASGLNITAGRVVVLRPWASTLMRFEQWSATTGTDSFSANEWSADGGSYISVTYTV